MNGLSQVYNAARDNSSIVVTAGHKDTGVLAGDGFCAGPDLPALARGFVKHAWQSLTPDAVGSDVRRAINVAAANPPGPTYLAIPEDIQAGAASPLDPAQQSAFTATANAHLERRPDAGAVAAAVRMLLDARRPMLVLGSATAAHAGAARALAEALELPVFAIERTQLNELPYPVADPRYLGQYGEQRPLIADADVVAVIGARAFFPFSTESMATLPADAKLIHASSDAAQIGWSIVPDVGLAGDAAPVIADLLAATKAAGGLGAQARAERIARLEDLRTQYRAANAKDRARHDELAREAHAVSLVALTDALGATLPAGALVFDEAISSSRAVLRHTVFPDGSRVFRTNGGSLGWGLPAAVGAKIACPDRTVVCIVGDGTFHFTPQALWTSAQENAPVVTVIVDNSGYLAVKLSIERHLGVDKDTQHHPGTNLPALDHVTVAQGYGANAMRIDDPAQLQPALAAAMTSNRSTVIVVPVANARR
jgi:benzoylformate decarboxylase